VANYSQHCQYLAIGIYEKKGTAPLAPYLPAAYSKNQWCILIFYCNGEKIALGNKRRKVFFYLIDNQ
jgi:hypothetical protein